MNQNSSLCYNILDICSYSLSPCPWTITESWWEHLMGWNPIAEKARVKSSKRCYCLSYMGPLLHRWFVSVSHFLPLLPQLHSSSSVDGFRFQPGLYLLYSLLFVFPSGCFHVVSSSKSIAYYNFQETDWYFPFRFWILELQMMMMMMRLEIIQFQAIIIMGGGWRSWVCR